MKQKYVLRAALLAIAAIVLILAGGLFFRGTHDRTSAAQTPNTAPTITPTATGLAPRTPDFASPRNASLPVAATNQIFLTAALLWQKPIAEEAFAQFHDWAERYAAGGISEKSALEVEGIALAHARREALAALIKTDPKRALELSVPMGVRRALPSAVQSLLEERVSGRGTLAVLGVLPEPGKEDQVAPTIRTAQLGTRELNAFVYGRRLGEPTRANIPLNGIAVDNYFAVNENAVRLLEPEEVAEAKPQSTEAICSVSGQAANILQQEVAAEVGGQAVFLCRPDHVVDLNERVVAAESGPPGPEGGGPEASTWTEGLKKLILIRVDFPDLALSLTESGGATLVSNLHNFYSEMSYRRTGFQPVGSGSDVTPTFRMTNAAAWYGTNDYYNQLRTEARAAATAAGYVLGNYDRDVICLGAVPGFGWSGLAYVGGAGAWLRDSFGTGVAAHELGHNWGLNHANFWDTSSQSVIGPGASIEYGDSFDTMGSASAGNNHFNARYKNYLNWLTMNEVVTATTNGTYRVYAHDDPNSSGIRGLKIVKNSQTNYWVEFRQKFTGVKGLMNGAGLRWAQSGNQKSHLLDTTPGSTDLKNDAAIVIGRTFSDQESGIHITPIGKGGTSPESLDVVVNLGSFPADLPPTLGLTTSATNVAPGVAIDFTANASDPDGDSLAYWWDFGDGTFATTNRAVARKSWSATGEYLVRCVASDLKGGVADKYVVVTIGSPTTFRISGRITDGNAPLEGVRVYVSTARMSYTDSDGNYTIVGLPAGSYNVNAMLHNYSFTAPGFSNPVSVGPNKSAIDFLASDSGSSPPTITTQPFSQAVNSGANATFTVAATGTPPPAYQWRFNGANISGATVASYTKSNVQATDAGNYSVVASNVAGTATSVNAVLTVNSAPAISSSPQNQTVIAGNNATFTVTAGGTAPLYYQWHFNNTNLVGATASSFTRVAAQPADAGGYRVVVTNSLGSVTSAVAMLTITVPPGLATQPQNQTALAGQTVSFGVIATGTAPLSYQWRFNGAPVAGATDSAFTIANAQPVHAGTYSVVVTNVAGSVTSASATLSVNIPPGIAAQPQDQNVVVGQLASFSVVATGTQPLRYQWSLNGGAMPGATNTSLSLSNVLAANAGAYTVVVTNVAGSVTSAVATLTVTIPPGLTAQPQDQTVVAGQTASFSVAATGTAPLTYQWNFIGTPIADANDSVFTITNAQPVNAGAYSVVVANVAGSITSAVATLTMNVPPGITAQPQDQSVLAGQPANFSVTADGTTPLSYQWKLDGAAISGATASALNLANAQLANAGAYTVVVTNVAGSITSAVANLTVNFTLTATAGYGGTVTRSPDQLNYAPNSAVTLTASASVYLFAGWSGDASGTNNPLTVILTTNQIISANFTSPVPDLIIDNPAAIFTGTWTSDTSAADEYGADYKYTGTSPNSISATATFTPTIAVAGSYDVYVWVPTITKGAPNAQFILADNDGGFTNTVSESSGSGGWLLLATGRNFASGTNGYVRFTNLGAGGKNAVADAVRWVYADTQNVTPPGITGQPQDQTVSAGQSANFTVSATGTAPLSYQWRQNGAAISDATASALSIINAQPADAGDYTVVVTNLAGASTSAVAMLTVNLPPGITAQPQDQTVITGQPANFGVTASGTAPMNYQWLLNGVPMPGATNLDLNFASVQPADAGEYTVVLTNVAGSVTSGVAILTLIMPPEITVSPQPLRVIEGQDATFSVTATGSDPLVCQWRFGEAAISGATNATLWLSNTTPASAGNYSVTITNLAGTVTSTPAALVISVRPVMSSFKLPAHGQIEWQLTGTPGDTYAIESSSNLHTWTPAATLTNTTGTLQFTDPTAANQPRRFYRVRLVP